MVTLLSVRRTAPGATLFVLIRVHSWFSTARIRLRQFVHAIEPAGLGRPAGIHQLNVPPGSGKGAVNSRPTAGPDGVAALQLIVSAHNGRNLDEHIRPADSNRCDANFVTGGGDPGLAQNQAR